MVVTLETEAQTECDLSRVTRLTVNQTKGRGAVNIYSWVVG
jgi:hypothetical protein